MSDPRDEQALRSAYEGEAEGFEDIDPELSGEPDEDLYDEDLDDGEQLDDDASYE
jgi:hypothetical protein